MTLIAFATYGDHAEFVTDTVSYTSGAEEMGRCTKHATLNHLDAAVLTQGDSLFGDYAMSGANQVSGRVPTFDELVDLAPTFLAQCWADRVAQQGGNEDAVTESVVFLIGWSDRAQAFTSHAFASEQSFKRLTVTRPWVMPAPWVARPSGLELRRMKRWMANHSRVDEAAEQWAQAPQMKAPTSIDQWVGLARLARDQRSLSGGFAHVIVAGDVFHTRLSRGAVNTQRVYTFNDAGDEFLRMVAGTYHPLALAAACSCESGKPSGECCGRHSQVETQAVVTA
jgi:hypothetical protein